MVILVKRFENDYLIARVRDGEQRRDHAFGGPAADRNFAFRVDFEPVGARIFTGDGVAERLRAPGDRVLVVVGLYGVDGGLFEVHRGGEIGVALGEVDRAVPDRQTRHLADDGLGKVGGTGAAKALRGRG